MRLPVQAIGLLAAALYVPCHSAAAVVALSLEGVQAFTNGTLSVAVMSLPELDVAVSYEHELIVNFYSDACEHCEVRFDRAPLLSERSPMPCTPPRPSPPSSPPWRGCCTPRRPRRRS